MSGPHRDIRVLPYTYSEGGINISIKPIVVLGLCVIKFALGD